MSKTWNCNERYIHGNVPVTGHSLLKMKPLVLEEIEVHEESLWEPVIILHMIPLERGGRLLEI